MNINLSSEIIWILAVNSLIGLWLIWQTVKIYPNIDILKISVNWFSNRPIILPSLLFLICPFLSTYIFHKLPPNFNNIFDNKIIAQLLLTVGTVISIYIGNILLDIFRKIQEKKKIAKILIAGMEVNLEYLNKIQKNLSGTQLKKLETNNIERIINQIKTDYIYESALKLVGIFDSKNIDVIYKYSNNLNYFLDDILNSYEKIDGFISNTHLLILKEKIKAISMEAKINIITLSKEIVQDNDKFNTYTKSIIYEYGKNKAKGDMYSFSTLEMQDILERVKILFEGYGLHSEIDASYNKEKNLLSIELNSFMEECGITGELFTELN